MSRDPIQSDIEVEGGPLPPATDPPPRIKVAFEYVEWYAETTRPIVIGELGNFIGRRVGVNADMVYEGCIDAIGDYVTGRKAFSEQEATP